MEMLRHQSMVRQQQQQQQHTQQQPFGMAGQMVPPSQMHDQNMLLQSQHPAHLNSAIQAIAARSLQNQPDLARQLDMLQQQPSVASYGARLQQQQQQQQAQLQQQHQQQQLQHMRQAGMMAVSPAQLQGQINQANGFPPQNLAAMAQRFPQASHGAGVNPPKPASPAEAQQNRLKAIQELKHRLPLLEKYVRDLENKEAYIRSTSLGRSEAEVHRELTAITNELASKKDTMTKTHAMLVSLQTQSNNL
jgi:hypothetical protein